LLTNRVLLSLQLSKNSQNSHRQHHCSNKLLQANQLHSRNFAARHSL